MPVQICQIQIYSFFVYYLRAVYANRALATKVAQCVVVILANKLFIILLFEKFLILVFLRSNQFQGISKRWVYIIFIDGRAYFLNQMQ